MNQHMASKGMSAASDLRRRALEQLKTKAPETGFSQADSETQRLLHELQVHQIELEMQNAELCQARYESESSLEKYTELYDFAPVSYFTLDLNGSISAVNLSGASLIGGTRSGLIGRRFGLLVAAKDRPAFTDFLGKVLACRVKESCEVALLNKRDQAVIVQIEAMATASGQEFRLVLIDITERKQLGEKLQKTHDELELILSERTRELTWAKEQQKKIADSNRRLEEASRTKSDFLANMSHELRTPLNSVIGFSEVLQGQLFGKMNEKQLEYVNNVLTSGRKLLSLINDILDYSKVGSSKMELELSDFSLWETVDASLMRLREKALKGGLKIHTDLAEEADIRIVADRRKLKQILFNLLSNAVKFTPVGGTVDVSAVRDGDFIEIRVADTGMGIKEEDIPKLFQPFTQLESVYTKEFEGTGLGLALTRQLVELHGGRIRVESQFGAGSRFSFTILQPEAATKDPPPAAPGEEQT